MTTSRWLFVVSAMVVAESLQQTAQLVRETPVDAFHAVSSKMDELHAGLAKAKADTLKAVTEQKVVIDSKLAQLLKKNRDAASKNALLAEDVKNLRKSNIELRETARELTEECQFITIELKEMQSNISMAQEFIAHSVNSSSRLLHDSPELRILTDLANTDAATEREKHHEKSLNDLEQLAGNRVSMIQLGAMEKKPATEGLLQELLSSWNSVSSQQSTSLLTLREAFDEERHKIEQTHEALLLELDELNATMCVEEGLNVKLQRAVAHLKVSREHLLRERVALQTFAKRLGDLSIRGEATPPPNSLSLPAETVNVSKHDADPPAMRLRDASTWLKWLSPF